MELNALTMNFLHRLIVICRIAAFTSGVEMISSFLCAGD